MIPGITPEQVDNFGAEFLPLLVEKAKEKRNNLADAQLEVNEEDFEDYVPSDEESRFFLGRNDSGQIRKLHIPFRRILLIVNR